MASRVSRPPFGGRAGWGASVERGSVADSIIPNSEVPA